MDHLPTQDTAAIRGYDAHISRLRAAIAAKGKDTVVEWCGLHLVQPHIGTPPHGCQQMITHVDGQMRPETLQESLAGSVDEDLRIRVPSVHCR